MSAKKYSGSCHCGKVRFEADIDLSAGTGKCNCSICTKTRSWSVLIKPSAFRLLAGEGELSDYQFGSSSMHHLFCKHCGVRSFGTGKSPRIGPFVSINLSCLDDVTEAELVNAPITYLNGRDDIWDAPPAETRHL